MRVRVVHLSDFHLSKDTLRDWKQFAKKALLAELTSIQEEGAIGLIVFTGDLIDMGGKDFGGAPLAFAMFDAEVVAPILESLSLPRSRFIVIPGNHDVERELDASWKDDGLKGHLVEASRISDFIEKVCKGSLDGCERIKAYSDFEAQFYNGVQGSERIISPIGSSHKLDVAGAKVGVLAFNSAWRCYGRTSDKGALLIGEDQFSRLSEFVEDCEVRISLLHHPFDWLSEVEGSWIKNQIARVSHLVLYGHMHENHTSVHTGIGATGAHFTNLTASGISEIRTDSRRYSNGFSLIDFDPSVSEVRCVQYRYNHDHLMFVRNTDYFPNNGEAVFKLPSKSDAEELSVGQRCVEHIKAFHFPAMDQHLVSDVLDDAPRSIKEVFVMPPLSDAGDLDGSYKIELAGLIKAEGDTLFLGQQEYGKTMLLYRTVVEVAEHYEDYGLIPVYVDFTELGSRDLITVIKSYLDCSSKDAKYLLDLGQVVLLVDNLSYKDDYSYQYAAIHKFKKTYPSTRLVATTATEISGILPREITERSEIVFHQYVIDGLKARHIRDIMRVWLPSEDTIESNNRLERLVTGFHSYALPCTPLSVSLFVWSIEKSKNRPTNNAVLLEIYMEIILDKVQRFNIYRESFDFKNKMQILASIAHQMLLKDEPGYSLSYSDFAAAVESYLKEVGFEFDPERIIDYFLQRKVFVKNQTGRIKFAYSCFFQFFLAKRMEFNSDFKDHVLREENYFKFSRELDFYTALVRSDRALLELVVARFEKAFAQSDALLSQIDLDTYFKVPTQPQVKEISTEQVRESRPTDERLEEVYDKMLQRAPNAAEILHKDEKFNLELLLIILATVLRNSEGVEDLDLKRRAYRDLLKYSLIWSVLYQRYFINYVVTNRRYPANVPEELEFEQFIRNVPFHVQLGMSYYGGTNKLSKVVREKIHEDAGAKGSLTGTEMEAFFSVMYYADVEGPEYDVELRKFVKKINNNLVRDYSLFKLLGYYFRRTKAGGENEQKYLGLISELKVRTLGLSARLKEKVMGLLKEEKKTKELEQ